MWRSPAEDLICHSSKKRRDKTNIPPKNSLTPHRHTPYGCLSRHSLWQRRMPSYRTGSYPAPRIPSSLKLRRDKAIGVTHQRNRRAGGTPGRRKPPCNKKSVYVQYTAYFFISFNLSDFKFVNTQSSCCRFNVKIECALMNVSVSFEFDFAVMPYSVRGNIFTDDGVMGDFIGF